MLIDCDTCTVRGEACGDCVVGVLLGTPSALDIEEQRALGVLAASGLVPPLRLAPSWHEAARQAIGIPPTPSTGPSEEDQLTEGDESEGDETEGDETEGEKEVS